MITFKKIKKPKEWHRSRKTKFGQWLVIASLAGFKLEQYDTRPAQVAGVDTPENLDELTIGQLMQLGTLQDGNIAFYEICKIVMGLPYSKTKNARAIDVVHFCGWVWHEVELINKLFESTETKPTANEIKAGVKDLKFGLFGLLDWYALRMGITDHDAVLSTPWMRIYKCLEMDSKKNQYNKRLSEVMSDEYRRQIKANR